MLTNADAVVVVLVVVVAAALMVAAVRGGHLQVTVSIGAPPRKAMSVRRLEEVRVDDDENMSTHCLLGAAPVLRRTRSEGEN